MSEPDDLDEFIADQTADPAFAQHLEALRKHADDRPKVTTGPERSWDEAGCSRRSCKDGHSYRWGACAYAPEPPPTLARWKVFTASDGNLSIGTETLTAEQVAEWLREQGYTVAPRASQEPAHWPVVSRMRSGEWGVHCLACSIAARDHVPRCLVFADDWPPLVLTEALRCDLMEAKASAAARASQGHQEPASVPCGPGVAQCADGGAAAESEPRYIVETNHFGQWLHGLEFDDLTEARDYAEYCHATYGGARIIRVTREVIT